MKWGRVQIFRTEERDEKRLPPIAFLSKLIFLFVYQTPPCNFGAAGRHGAKRISRRVFDLKTYNPHFATSIESDRKYHESDGSPDVVFFFCYAEQSRVHEAQF